MNKKENTNKSETAKREEAVIALWNDNDIFEKSLKKEAPNGEFVFYDGPPFATGLPHYGSLLSSVIKDTVGRYKTMRGYHVPRRWGWDCHGLPIENMIEKKLELKTKKDIEAYGIDKFNEEAKSAVLHYADEWKDYVERIGRWVDFDNSYKTMDNTYIESVWWALKQIHTDKRLYEGRKVLMYCPRCETPLSKAEIAMDNSYKDVTETAVTAKFKVKPDQKIGNDIVTDDNTYILAWTTTPWTLPGNVALAVGESIEYFLLEEMVDFGSEEKPNFLIVAKDIFEKQAKENQKIKKGYVWELGTRVVNVVAKKEMQGKDLVGLSYAPLYEVKKAVDARSKKAWTVQTADFVTTEEGTGVVHTAPMYGEDDYQFGLKHELPIVPILDATGTYNDDAPELVRHMYHKKGGKVVLKDLEERGLVFDTHNHTHSYPHCYRCDTALIYNALTSWFIDIQSVKEKLLAENENINWYPEHLKHGRFQNIVESAPDWTISRNRFWASPLPIWKEKDTDTLSVIGSLAELREHTKKSGNTYLCIRHGEAESNVAHVISSLPENKHHVTEKGKAQLQEAGKELKKKGITKIIASPLVRTKESAEILAKEIDYTDDIIYDERIQEWQLGDLNNKPVNDLKKTCPTYEDRFRKGCGSGETLTEMKERIGEALYELEETYEGEVILIVGHEYTAWLAECVTQGADTDASIAIRGTADDYIGNAEIRTIDFVPLPHNHAYELDLHRPYIDGLELVTKEGKALERIPEVVDCWVESGSMPFASEHYPHEHKELTERRYPGDFIAEYIAQTRTWFYYMHAMGVLLFGERSFKNCVTTGTLLAADGAKISKSKKNFTDPRENINRYGADAMRYYMLSSTVMSAEDAAFKDEELREAHNRFINMMWNSYKFYEMYADTRGMDNGKGGPPQVLDQWIMARLRQVMSEVTGHMDSYNTIRSTRVLREFVTDLSTWYIRRSRDRFKSDDDSERQVVLAYTREIFLTLAKLIAPITPFIAESLYKGVGGNKESVHLEAWPENTGDVDTKLIEDMSEVRRIASLALEVRQREGVKVRQPLAMITLNKKLFSENKELVPILLDEINVKEFSVDTSQEAEVVLDTELTPELKAEGAVRDVVRVVQGLRKENDLLPEDMVTLVTDADEDGNGILAKAEPELMRVAGVSDIQHKTLENGTQVTAGGTTFSLAIQKK